MATTIIVPQARPAVPNVRRTHWKVDVQALVVGALADLAAHLAGSKFRLAAYRLIDWNAPATDTILQTAPTGGPHTHTVWWESSPFATHVAVIMGYQCYAVSNTPEITVKLKKRNGDPIDTDGVVWTEANGGLVQAIEPLRVDPGPTPIWTYPMQYTSSTGRIVDPIEIVGETDPRLLNVGANAGDLIKVEAVAEWCRLHFLAGIEAVSETITQA